MKLRVLKTAATAILLSQLSYAQDDRQIPTYRVTSQRIVFEFLAIDKKTGQYIDNLKKGDLELKVDGKKQKIDRLFPPRPPIDASADSGEAESPALTSARTFRTVILLDSRVLDAGNFHQTKEAIRTFLRTSLQSDHLVMLANIDRSLNVLSTFTRDEKVLLESVEGLRPATLSNPLDRSRMLTNRGRDYMDELQRQVVYLRSGLTLLCHTLSGLPGRKQIVFFSEGYPIDPVADLEFEARQQVAFATSTTARQESSQRAGSTKDPGVLPMLRQVIGLANNFGITFYAVDARGLVAVPGLAATASGSRTDPDTATIVSGGQPLDQSGLTTFRLSTLDSIESARNALIALAGGTNGSAFYNSNDLTAVLRASSEEQRHVYLASFVPTIKKKEGRFRKIQVKAKKKNISLRSQVGYLDADERRATSERLGSAFAAPNLFSHLTPVLEFESNGTKTVVIFGLAGSQVEALPLGDKMRIDLTFLGQVFNSDGDRISDKFEVARAFQTDLPNQRWERIAAEEVLGSQELELPSGKYRIVLVAEDRIAGTLGVTSREFEMP